MINTAIVGHIDHGKSTLIGRLLYDTGKLSEEKLKKFERQALSIGKKSFEFAYTMDKTMEERVRGITIELSFESFETKDRKINIIDAPGHKDFVKNMITGASEADVGILVIDTMETNQKGLQPQTKEHSFLLYTLGVNQLIVVLNKMDKAEYLEEIYENVKEQLKYFLNTIGFKDIKFVPTSAYYGDNVVKHSDNMPWYKGETFIQLLNSLKVPERLVDKPFRLPILRTFKIKGAGTVIAGKIESGKIKVGDNVIIVPYPGLGKIGGVVKSIEWQHTPLKEAEAGIDVGILLTRLEKGFVSRQVKKGYVLGDVNDPPKEVKEFIAKIIIFDHPTSIGIGYSPVLHCHQSVVPCSIMEMKDKFDSKTMEIIEKEPSFLKNGEGATVLIIPHKPLVIEEVKKIPRMGRFALRDMGRTIGAGMCIEAIPK